MKYLKWHFNGISLDSSVWILAPIWQNSLSRASDRKLIAVFLRGFVYELESVLWEIKKAASPKLRIEYIHC